MVSGDAEDDEEQETVEINFSRGPEDAKIVPTASKKRKVRCPLCTTGLEGCQPLSP